MCEKIEFHQTANFADPLFAMDFQKPLVRSALGRLFVFGFAISDAAKLTARILGRLRSGLCSPLAEWRGKLAGPLVVLAGRERIMWNKLPDKIRPSGKGVTENVIANLFVAAALTIPAAILTRLADLPSDREVIEFFLRTTLILCVSAALAAWVWKNLRPKSEYRPVAADRMEPPLAPQPELPRRLPPYEAEQKLRLIDAALEIVRRNFLLLDREARRLASDGYQAALSSRQDHIDRLKLCRDDARSNEMAIKNLCEKYPEHADIVGA